MERIQLIIKNSQSQFRCKANKWKFQDSMMGEQYITLTIVSEKPVEWAVGDYCEFRGEVFTLNYIPSATQKAGTGEIQDSYTYENVKFDSRQEELTRCLMLDIAGEYDPAQGTNYTGSSVFQLYCGETVVNGTARTPVCTLADKMQANLNRMFGTGANKWTINVDLGNTKTEDKMMSFSNMTVAQALAEVHNTFELNYSVRGRTITIGATLKNLTSDNDSDAYAFGYGKGYPTKTAPGTALTQIKRISNSNQQIVTRLRVLGSQKNLPYRYYNKKYGLSQSLFPTSLQLPDTFLPMTDSSHPNKTKTAGNARRDSMYGVNAPRHVLGETNDAYIDKNDDAASCVEGIREHCVVFDGSNNLEEIYPTIEGAKYSELRGAGVKDMDGYPTQQHPGSFTGYNDNESVDELLAVGRMKEGSLVDDANVGDGIMSDFGKIVNNAYPVSIPSTRLRYLEGKPSDFTDNTTYYIGREETLLTIQDVNVGSYALAPTEDTVFYGFNLVDGISAKVGFIVRIKKVVDGTETLLSTYLSSFTNVSGSSVMEVEMPALPGGGDSIDIDERCDVVITFIPRIKDVVSSNPYNDCSLNYYVGNTTLGNGTDYQPRYVWFSTEGEATDITTAFHVLIKDMGFDLAACFGDDTPKVVMKSGSCVGREFEIGSNVVDVEYERNGQVVKGRMLTLKRATDQSLNTYYPSEVNPLSANDKFVLVGIDMPDAYIEMAEVRLLIAATDWLAKNCDTAFTYQPYLDEIYLQRNYDRMVEQNTVSDSIFWRLYAGLMFSFNGIPLSEGGSAPLTNITIEAVTITMGDGLVPKVEIKLNDDVQQTTLQKVVTTVNKLVNGELFGGNGSISGTSANVSALIHLIETEGAKLFLSKTSDDAAQGNLEFRRDVTIGNNLAVGGRAEIDGDVSIAGRANIEGNVSLGGDIETDRFTDVAGQIQGAQITHAGKGTFAKLKASSFEIYELIYNRIRATGGRQAFTGAAGIVEGITEVTGTGETTPASYILDIKLDEDAPSKVHEFAVGDIIYSYVNSIGESGSAATGGQCWMHVTADSVEGHRNAIVAQMYPEGSDLDVYKIPVVENLLPEVGMCVTHWGNLTDNTRQTTFFIDCESGNIMQLMGVDRPIIGYNGNEGSNYGAIIGRLPADLAAAITSQTGFVINPYQPYAYLRGVIAQDFIQMDYRGKVIKAERFRGEWDSTTAAGEDPYRNTATEFHTVTHNGSLYACVLDSNTSEPGTNGNWFLLQSGAGLSMYQLRTDPTSINVRSDGSYDPQSTITAWVNKGSVGHEITQLSEQSQLDAEGLVIEYSVDGTNWTEITIGQEGDLDMENGEDVIEGEDGTPITLEVDDIDFDAVRNNSNKINFRLRRTSDDAILDSTDISVAIDGQNAVRVDLDNENDSMLYSNTGTLLSGNVVSNAHLYDGKDEITTGVTWSITATGCTASISGNQITVSAMSADTAKVVVTGTYDSKTYPTELTLKKIVGEDKVDIIPSVNNVVKNNSNAFVPAVVSLEFRRLTADGTASTISTLSALSALGYSVQYSKDNLSWATSAGVV